MTNSHPHDELFDDTRAALSEYEISLKALIQFGRVGARVNEQGRRILRGAVESMTNLARSFMSVAQSALELEDSSSLIPLVDRLLGIGCDLLTHAMRLRDLAEGAEDRKVALEEIFLTATLFERVRVAMKQAQLPVSVTPIIWA